MNLYDNKNECEILEDLPNNTNILNRYPLANNPYSSTLNINSCQSSGVANWVNIIGDAAREAVSIGTTVISLLAAPSLTGMISLAFNLISRMGTGSTGRSISELSICDLLSIIDLRVNQVVLNDGIADFNGALAVYNLYLQALNSWNNNPNPATAEEVRTRFRISDSEFTRILTQGSLTHGGSLARQDAQLLLLPSFTNAAYLHLLLLRDACINGANWGLFGITPANNYQSRLLDLIERYTNYCTHWYNQGLTEIRQRGNSATVWLEFHRYRRDMTLMVLDIASSFSNFDITRYAIATDIQLSRTIYTDPIGFVNRGSGNRLSWFAFQNQANFSALESEIPNPSFPQFLNNMLIFTGPLSLPASPNTHRARVWYGNQNNFNGSSSQISGEVTNDIQSIVGLNVFRIDSEACNLNNTTYGVNRAEFYHDVRRSVYQGYIRTSGLDNPVVQRIQTYFPGENSDIPTQNDYTHILSRPINITGGIRQVATNRRSSLVVYGWIHKSLSRQNRVAPNKITQVPAVKASTSSNCTVISGPGFTGGDLVRLHPNGQFVIQLQFPTPQANYRIRLRYASALGSSINIIFNAAHLSTLPSTASSLDNLQYNDFGYFTVNGTFIPSLGNSLTIVNTSSNSNLVIDKIEFIPENIFLNQSMENAEKAVNDLFINK